MCSQILFLFNYFNSYVTQCGDRIFVAHAGDTRAVLIDRLHNIRVLLLLCVCVEVHVYVTMM